VLNGQVETVTYLGSIVRIGLGVEGQFLSLDIFNERKMRMPQIGEAYPVHFPAEACWLMEGDDV
jgi:putative spermidine/putrescine transport system ATP-binding protein